MTRYYFHIHDHGALIPDDEGLELSGIGAARAECLQSINDLLLADRLSGRVSSTMVEIADQRGEMLDAMPVRCVLH